eukprot:SAG31_NODE_1288_length_8994_cov_4.105003_8_plen_509_part_00
MVAAVSLLVAPESASATAGRGAPALPADGSIKDLFVANSQKNISSMWGPSLAVTKSNTIVAFGECDRSASSHDPWMCYRRSMTGGETWESLETLYPCGSPAALYSAATDTLFVFFGECGPPTSAGPPYGLTAVSCASSNVHWRYNASLEHLRNTNIAKPGSPLGVRICEGAVKPSAGDGLAVGMPPDQSEPCPAMDLRWKIEGPPTNYVRHMDTGLCLTIPPRKSAVLQTCGAGKGEGQQFIWNGDTLKLAPGMFRSGECLGYLNKSIDSGSTHIVADKSAAAAAGKPGKLCTQTQDLYCNRTRHRQVLEGYPKCKACLGAHAAELKSAKCTPEQMEFYCGYPIGPAPTVGPKGEKSPPKGASTVVMRSTDSGSTFSAPELINVTNTWGPHYTGNDLAHGIELVQDGPHKGRLAIARRYDGVKSVAAEFSRSYVLYSDTHGLTWSAGELLPRKFCSKILVLVLGSFVPLGTSVTDALCGTLPSVVGWTECQVAAGGLAVRGSNAEHIG